MENVKFGNSNLNISGKTLEGSVALVTGGSAGIGFGAAKQLAEAGAFVYIVSRRQKQIEEAAARLGPSVRGIAVDVTNKEDLKRLAETIQKDHGGLDIVFANAGGGRPIALEELTEGDIDHLLGVNIKGVIFTVQTMLPILKDGSSIILNASITADMGLPGFSVYAATKAAVRSLARSWTTDLKHRHIRVNTVSPGVVPTEGYRTEQKMTEEQVSDYAQRVTSEIPVGRVGTPEDIGNAVVFLASDSSSFITGIDLVVDGGQTRVYQGKN
ncbi:SDR family NAD(P)-dependent oxidoreductase [Trichococcus pasteurii]|uniref:Glucose/ribitol dehydrogenase n=1 Tax=Trichococcus pasteurii TaxID=43064 RepID=A0A1W1IDK9_9LACT|nr:SDR family oxidoreductase [Trichococcus pasteurii]SFE86627.1 NAD(P)-dependent dehydrogenase, short-chain alcohol dehydrogenase family [Trichococcus pasteurii]SLM51114.1 glucose/ribitol dehydrogenase [Trichococcus pasteurii]SSB91995.1 glucose/ribitol dehydrogenase [Trichococcus pasteurii]